MTFVSWLALYPAVTLVFLLFGDLLAQIPLLLRTMAVTIVVMLLMSYVLMPRMTVVCLLAVSEKEPRCSLTARGSYPAMTNLPVSRSQWLALALIPLLSAGLLFSPVAGGLMARNCYRPCW